MKSVTPGFRAAIRFRRVELWELALIAVWSFLVAMAGGLAGLVMGNLRLPLVLQFASSPSAGAGANVAISAASALTASVAHWRAGRIDWRLFRLMAPPSFAGGLIGGAISGLLPKRLLLAVIAVIVLQGSFELHRRGRSEQPPPEPPDEVRRGPALAIAFVVGVLGGVVGLILGSLRLPAMVRWLGTTPRQAVGTNAATGAVVGVGGLVGHITGGVDWAILAAGVAGAVPGAAIGARLTGRLGDRELLQAISVILLIAGISLALEAVLGA